MMRLNVTSPEDLMPNSEHDRYHGAPLQGTIPTVRPTDAQMASIPHKSRWLNARHTSPSSTRERHDGLPPWMVHLQTNARVPCCAQASTMKMA
jgi:hypothetical protein